MLLCLSVIYLDFSTHQLYFNVFVIRIKLILTFTDANILPLMRSDTVLQIKVRSLISSSSEASIVIKSNSSNLKLELNA